MIRPELFKIRHHRTPWVLAGLYALFILAPPVYLAFRPPADAEVYLEGITAVHLLAGVLLASVFGGWLMGHEYRQGTLRRVAATDARRHRLLATKGLVGLLTLATALTVGAALGTGAAALSAAANDHTLVYDGLVRDFLSNGFLIGFIGAIAYGLSIILRSDTYAMLSSLAIMVVIGPLLELIPTIGKYMPSAVTNRVASSIAETEVFTTTTSLSAALFTVAAMLAVVAAGAAGLFATRDI